MLNFFPFPSIVFTIVLTFKPAIEKCEKKVLSYNSWKEAGNTQWHLQLQHQNGGWLSYFGAEHTDDPAHPQFSDLENQYRQAKPGVVFFEGPDRGTATTAEETIRQFGESGYVRFLAKQHGIQTKSLEPEPAQEVQYILDNSRYSKEQVKLFYVLREANRLQVRKGMGKEAIEDAMANQLKKSAQLIPALAETLPTLADVEVAYKKYWNTPAEWWQAPSSWFDPLQKSKKSGGRFTNDINRLSSEFRDLHMYHLLTQAVQRGERVFAVAGRNHVPMQTPALRCALE